MWVSHGDLFFSGDAWSFGQNALSRPRRAIFAQFILPLAQSTFLQQDCAVCGDSMVTCFWVMHVVMPGTLCHDVRNMPYGRGGFLGSPGRRVQGVL